MSKKSPFGTIFQDFCNDFYLAVADKDFLPLDTYTHVSAAYGTTSWLDHIICTSDAKECITNMKVYYDVIHSPHDLMISYQNMQKMLKLLLLLSIRFTRIE